MRITATVCINAPVEMVWAVLSDLEAIHLWVRVIRRSYCPDQRRGVGALRVCELNRATLRETIVDWNEGRSFTYRGEGAPMMKSAQNTWSVEADSAQTVVTTTAEVELKGGPFGLLLTPLVKWMSRRMGTQSLASLKYLVEHGEPYRGNDRLAPAPATC